MKKIIFLTVLLSLTVFNVSNLKAYEDDPVVNFNTVLSNYYKNPQPEVVAKHFGKVANSDFIKTQSTDVSGATSYAFGRLAQLEPSLVPEYLKEFQKFSSHEARVFALMVFTLCGNDEVVSFLEKIKDEDKYANEKEDIKRLLTNGIPVDFKALENEVKTGTDLDFLWIEFMITGKKEPIKRIIDVLNWEDILRKRVIEWVRTNPSKKQKEFVGKILNDELGMNINFDTVDVLDTYDLDGQFSAAVRNGGASREDIKKIREIIEMNDEDLWKAAVKGSAVWALISNAQQHSKVFQYCVEEYEQRNDKAKKELEVILNVVQNNAK